MTPTEELSLKKREIKAEESNAMDVKDMGTFELNVLPFLRNKRNECLLLGLIVTQKVILKKNLPN